MTSSSLRRTPRLRPDVALVPAAHGHLLRVGDDHHRVELDAADLAELLDTLVEATPASSPPASAAAASLVDAGLVDPRWPRLRVAGEGALATAVGATLARMGVAADDGRALHAQDDADDLPTRPEVATCWAHGHRVLLAPPSVSAYDVHARHRAATLHRSSDPRLARAEGRGQGVVSSRAMLAGPGLELAAAQIAAELLRTARPAHEVVVIDVIALTVTRHPVLPVPPPPR